MSHVNVSFIMAKELGFFAEQSQSSSTRDNHFTEIISSSCSAVIENFSCHKSNENLLIR